jgi:hypothetical protein
VRRFTLALSFAIALAFPAQAAATPEVVHAWRANLDADPHMEHVRLVVSETANAAAKRRCESTGWRSSTASPAGR